MKKVILLLMLLFAISCGNSADTVAVVNNVGQEDLLGTWQVTKITIDTGNGDINFTEIGSEIMTFRFTMDSISIYISTDGTTSSKPYEYNNSTISYEHSKTPGEIVTFTLQLYNNDLVMIRDMSTNNSEHVFLMKMYSKKVD